VIEWAQAAGDAALELLGEATVRVGNSVSYVLSYLEHDFLEGIRYIVKGAFNAGYAVADFITWAASRAIQAVKEVVAALLELGVSLADIIADTIQHPHNALVNVVRAMRELGNTVEEIVDAAFVQPTEDATREVIETLHELGESAEDILNGALQISVGAVFLAAGVLLEILGIFRSLTSEERTEAQLVFGDSLPYDQIHVHIGSWLSDLTSWAQGNPNGLGTMRIIHFPTGTVLAQDVPCANGTFDWLMHELTHVWQGENVGPFYMGHAIYAQNTEGYDYSDGHPTKEAALEAAQTAGKTFAEYNPEQQGDIVADYYCRLKDGLDTSAWDPFVAAVHA